MGLDSLLEIILDYLELTVSDLTRIREGTIAPRRLFCAYFGVLRPSKRATQKASGSDSGSFPRRSWQMPRRNRA